MTIKPVKTIFLPVMGVKMPPYPASKWRPPWKPIETVPKDGTRVAPYDGEPVFLSFRHPNGHHWGFMVMYWNEGGFWEDGMGHDTSDYDKNCEAPTHWTPLPDPPQ
jgi:hypothetical protein